MLSLGGVPKQKGTPIVIPDSNGIIKLSGRKKRNQREKRERKKKIDQEKLL